METQEASARGADGGPWGASPAACAGWGGARSCVRETAGGVPETARGGSCEALRTASPPTRRHTAQLTRRGTPTPSHCLVRALVSAGSRLRGSGWGPSHHTLIATPPYDRFGGGRVPGGYKEYSDLISSRRTTDQGRSASRPSLFLNISDSQ